MTTLKDCADACMSLLNQGRIDNVFIEHGYIEVKAVAYHDGDEQVRNASQLKKELKQQFSLMGVGKDVEVEYVTTRRGYRFWNVSPAA